MTTLTLKELGKSYGRTRALSDLSLALESGEITGVVGPNGAGKSTLMRILSGEEVQDNGTLALNGRTLDERDCRSKVALVHQETQLWSNLTVGENLVVGREHRTFGRNRPEAADVAVLTRLGLAPYAHRELGLCPLAVRQRVEIGRALARDAECFLFDEPNSALTEVQSESLFTFMHELAAEGKVVLLISHRLAEVVEHSRSVLVIRDGRLAAVLSGEEVSEERLARELVVGHPTREHHLPARPDAKSASEASRAGIETGLAAPGMVTAVMGVEGSGARELVSALAAGSHASDVELVAADRRDSLFSNLTVGDNAVVRLGRSDIGNRLGFINARKIDSQASNWVKSLSVKTSGTRQPIRELSGGNQQKVAIASALAARPRILAVEEPTRGVDIASKADIYAILRKAAMDGISVVLLCTEVPEAFDVSDRVLVVDSGTVVAHLMVQDYEDVSALAAAVATPEHTLAHGHHLSR